MLHARSQHPSISDVFSVGSYGGGGSAGCSAALDDLKFFISALQLRGGTKREIGLDGKQMKHEGEERGAARLFEACQATAQPPPEVPCPSTTLGQATSGNAW